jgi:hypothetical protein
MSGALFSTYQPWRFLECGSALLCRFCFLCFWFCFFALHSKNKKNKKNQSGRAKHCRTPKKAEVELNDLLPWPYL